MTAKTLVFILGWLFLFLDIVWPTNKWGGRTTKIVLSSVSVGLFLANTIYTFMK